MAMIVLVAVTVFSVNGIIKGYWGDSLKQVFHFKQNHMGLKTQRPSRNIFLQRNIALHVNINFFLLFFPKLISSRKYSNKNFRPV
jgi:hypothetical protein